MSYASLDSAWVEDEFDQDEEASLLSQWVFEQFDENDSGWLESHEMQRALEVMMCSYCVDASPGGPSAQDTIGPNELAHMLQVMLKAVDCNNEGRIDSTEWTEFSCSIYKVTGRQRFMDMAGNWVQVLRAGTWKQGLSPTWGTQSAFSPNNLGPTVPKSIRRSFPGSTLVTRPTTREQVVERIQQLLHNSHTVSSSSYMQTDSCRTTKQSFFGSLKRGMRLSTSRKRMPALDKLEVEMPACRGVPRVLQRGGGRQRGPIMRQVIPLGSHSLPATATQFKHQVKRAEKMRSRALHLQEAALPAPRPGQLSPFSCSPTSDQTKSLQNIMGLLPKNSRFSVRPSLAQCPESNQTSNQVTLDDLPGSSMRRQISSGCSSDVEETWGPPLPSPHHPSVTFHSQINVVEAAGAPGRGEEAQRNLSSVALQRASAEQARAALPAGRARSAQRAEQGRASTESANFSPPAEEDAPESTSRGASKEQPMAKIVSQVAAVVAGVNRTRPGRGRERQSPVPVEDPSNALNSKLLELVREPDSPHSRVRVRESPEPELNPRSPQQEFGAARPVDALAGAPDSLLVNQLTDEALEKHDESAQRLSVPGAKRERFLTEDSVKSLDDDAIDRMLMSPDPDTVNSVRSLDDDAIERMLMIPDPDAEPADPDVELANTAEGLEVDHSWEDAEYFPSEAPPDAEQLQADTSWEDEPYFGSSATEDAETGAELDA